MLKVLKSAIQYRLGNTNNPSKFNSSSSTIQGFIPDHKRNQLQLLYDAEHLLDKIWNQTAEIERNESHKEYSNEIEKNLENIEIFQNKLKNQITLLKGERSNILAKTYFLYGKSFYLKAKMIEFSNSKPEQIKSIYKEAENYSDLAAKMFQELNNIRGEILSAELLGIIGDQFCPVCNKGSKQHNPNYVINLLKSLVKKIDLNHTSYHISFEITAHILSLLFAPIIGALEFTLIGILRKKNVNFEKEKEVLKNNLHKTSNKFRKKANEVKEHLFNGFSELLPLSLGYISSFAVIETLIKPNLATFILHQLPLAYFPKPLSTFCIWLMKVFYDSNDLKDLFLMKANIHHDLMKGYDNLVKHNHNKGNITLRKNLRNAEKHEKISKFFYREYIKMLNPIVDAKEVSKIQQYMQR
ncbi:MAG: hypothetical protein QNJ31_00875 [Candidatus Caenarcaniphilales bacterium]|nr:hypothetical protein [Candidatus Caenarcaniphilales bacterium]